MGTGGRTVLNRNTPVLVMLGATLAHTTVGNGGGGLGIKLALGPEGFRPPTVTVLVRAGQPAFSSDQYGPILPSQLMHKSVPAMIRADREVFESQTLGIGAETALATSIEVASALVTRRRPSHAHRPRASATRRRVRRRCGSSSSRCSRRASLRRCRCACVRLAQSYVEMLMCVAPSSLVTACP